MLKKMVDAYVANACRIAGFVGPVVEHDGTEVTLTGSIPTDNLIRLIQKALNLLDPKDRAERMVELHSEEWQELTQYLRDSESFGTTMGSRFVVLCEKPEVEKSNSIKKEIKRIEDVLSDILGRLRSELRNEAAIIEMGVEGCNLDLWSFKTMNFSVEVFSRSLESYEIDDVFSLYDEEHLTDMASSLAFDRVDLCKLVAKVTCTHTETTLAFCDAGAFMLKDGKLTPSEKRLVVSEAIYMARQTVNKMAQLLKKAVPA